MSLVKIIPNSEKVTTPKAGAPVEVAFDVSNPSNAPLKIGVDTVGELKERKWAQVDGAVEVTLPPLGQQKLKVTVTVPATAEPKDYTFKLRVYDPRDTTNADESTAIVVSLPKKETPPPSPVTEEEKKKKKLWIIIGAIVGGIIVVGGAAAAVIFLMLPAKMPDLLSKPTTLTEAKAILEKAKFQLAPGRPSRWRATNHPARSSSRTPTPARKSRSPSSSPYRRSPRKCRRW
jgi:hypothetical protein